MRADLGTQGIISVPAGFLFTDKAGTQSLLQLTQNPSDGDEVGTIVPAAKNQNYFVLFEFHQVGYVSDSDSGQLDADALLKSITDATERENEKRRAQGWSALRVEGWQVRPFYVSATHNLTWATLAQADGDTGKTVNYSTRILGRRGTMNVDLVIDADKYQTALPALDQLLAGFSFTPGNSYAEFVKGDKLAGYGLAALVAGGAAATAVKLGLLTKFWKLLVAGFLAAAAFIKKIFRRIFGGKEYRPDPTSADGPSE